MSINLNYIAWEKGLKITSSEKKDHSFLELYFMVLFFTKKGTPFVYLLFTNGTPLTYLV